MYKNMNTKKLIRLSLLTALCFIGTYMHISIPLGKDTMIHLGTTAIFLGAILVGPEIALPAGLGCALFDAMSPNYMVWVIPTFILKALTGYTAGKIAFLNNKRGNSLTYNIIGFIAGGIVSLIGYFIVNWLVFYGFKMAVVKLSSSIVTTMLGIIITVPISIVLKPIVNKTGLITE